MGSGLSTDMMKAEAEWRTIYTRAARKAAALAADSSRPLVCGMQLEMDPLHYCNKCHICGVECMSHCCPVGRNELTYTEDLNYEELSKKVKEAEKEDSLARARLFDSLDILRSGKGNTSEASVAAALGEQRLKNAKSNLKEIETERRIWMTNCGGRFKRILEIEQKAEDTRNAVDEYETAMWYEDMCDM